MSALSIFAEDSDPGDRPVLELHRAARDESGLPPVLLRLPELPAQAALVADPASESARRASRVYWGLVFIGGVVAICLNLPSRGKQPEPTTEQAPMWTAPKQITPKPSTPTRQGGFDSKASDAPAWPPAAPALSAVEGERAALPLDIGNARDATGPEGGQTPSQPIAPPIVPGEATPTGTVPAEPQ